MTFRTHWLDELFTSRQRGMTLLATIALSAVVAVCAGLIIALLSGVYALGLIFGLIVLVMILRSIEVGYAAVIAVITLLPFAAVPLPVGFKPTFLDLAVLGLFGVWLLERATGKLGGFINTPLSLPVLAFLTLAVASFVVGLTYAPLTQTVVRHFAELILSILLYFLVTDSVRDADRLRRITRFILIGGTVAAAIALALYLLPRATSMDLLSRLRVFGYPEGPGVLRFINDDPSLPQRATGTAIDPNALGGLLIVLLALGTPQLFARQPVIRRRWLMFGLSCMALALLFSFSRGSFVGIGVALLGLGIMRYRKLLLIIVIALALILMLPQTQAYVTHFFEGVQAQDLSTQMRLGEYNDALKLIQRYPILGVGFTGTPDIDTYLTVASLYLLMTGEMGLVGVSVFLIAMLVLFVGAWRVRSTVAARSDLEPIWWGFHAAMLGALVGGVFDHYFFNLDFQHSVTLFWLYLGLAAASTRLVKQNRSIAGEAAPAKT